MVTMTWLTRYRNLTALCLIAVGVAACEDSSDGITEPDPTSPSTFESTAAGYYHSCAVASDGVAFCWGYNRPSGQLGDGTTFNRILPVTVHGDLRFEQLVGGGSHTCGLTNDGEAYCWGDNEAGQLGNGGTEGSSTPAEVAGGHHFQALTAGESHTCGLSESGEAYCWGLNAKGQLGNGSNTNAVEPVQVSGGHTFVALFAGYEHTCGITGDGGAYCWGKNASGQLGDNTRTAKNTPVQVKTDVTFKTSGPMIASAGQNHTCAISTDNRAYCWGDNWHNQSGQTVSRNVFLTPMVVPDVPAMDRIAAGGDHSCALTPGGEAWCWGDSKRGQLGNADVEEGEFTPPVQVSDAHDFKNLSLGWDHTCGVTTSGEVLCWGYNGHGQVGTGDRTNALVPHLVKFESE